MKDKYDYSLLLGKMKSMGYTQEKLANAIPMAASTLNLKLNNKREFSQNQIKKICFLLGIYDIERYFFCKNTLEN